MDPTSGRGWGSWHDWHFPQKARYMTEVARQAASGLDAITGAGGQPVLDNLVALLHLERIEENIFGGVSPAHSPVRVFGGQVAGQALVAAGRTVPEERKVHSLHAYFIRG